MKNLKRMRDLRDLRVLRVWVSFAPLIQGKWQNPHHPAGAPLAAPFLKTGDPPGRPYNIQPKT
jgi:hypothetical protein